MNSTKMALRHDSRWVMSLMHAVIYCVVLCTLCSLRALSEDKLPPDTYRASVVPSNLTKDAHAVIRYELKRLTVSSTRNAKEKIHRVITVLDPDGRSFGDLVLYYDKFHHIENLEGRLFDKEGQTIRSLEGSDINDYAATESFSLYDDNRVRVATLYHSTYPYTLEYEFEISYDGYITWPSWYPEEKDASVEYSRFEVTVPSEMTFRIWKDITAESKVTTQDNRKTYLWEATSLKPFQLEPFGPDISDQYRSVRIAPDKFEIDGHPGDFSSWKSFGQWFYNLQANRQTLSPTVQQEAVAMTSSLSTQKEKIRRLYEYLQSKTRYVSVQLGIGGWQPFDAAYVCERGYGDCKALSNFMLSLLKAANIRAYPVLIYNGTPARNLVGNFPNDPFNHVIVCVPGNEDTTWLECTSQNIPFGHIGRGNENRYALLVTPEGGVLVRTPSSKATDNCQIRKATVEIAANGNGTANIRTLYTGNQQDYVRVGLNDVTPKEREEWVKENIEIPAFTLQTADYSQIESNGTTVSLGLQVQLPRYATSAGSRLLFQPNLMERRSFVPLPVQKRKHPILHSYPYTDIDSITYKTPDGFDLEALPKPVMIETAFAKYSSNITVLDPSSLLYCRHLEVTSSELPPEKYDEYRKFFQDVAQADKASAALVRK